MSNADRVDSYMSKKRKVESSATTTVRNNGDRVDDYMRRRTAEHNPKNTSGSNYADYKKYGYQTREAYDADVKKYTWAAQNQGMTYADVLRAKKNATGDELDYLNQYGTLVGYNSLADYDAELANTEHTSKGKVTASNIGKLGASHIGTIAGGLVGGLPGGVIGGIIGNNIGNKIIDDGSENNAYYDKLLQSRNLFEADHKFDQYSDIMNADDFDANSGYMGSGVKRPGMVMLGASADTNAFGTEAITDGIKKRLGIVDDKYTSDTYDRLNNKYYDRLDTNPDFQDNAYKYMDEDELKVFNYIYNTQGTAEAQKYLNDMNSKWERIRDKQMQQGISEFADSGFGANALLTGARIAAKPYANISSAMNIVGGAIGGEYDAYNASAMPTNFTDYSEREVGQNLNEAFNNPQVLGVDVPSFLYSTALSSIDSYIGAATFGSGYSVVMGTGAFQTTAKEMADKGATQQDIWVKAGAAGIAEIVTEHVSLESLEKIIKDRGLDSAKKVAFAALRQAGYEGSEEVASDIINHMVDEIYNGKASEMNQTIQRYIAEGMSEEDARAKAYQEFLIQMGESFVGGALSGGAAATFGGARQYYANSTQGADLRANDNLQYIDEAAQNIDKESQAFKDYSRLVGEETISNASNAQIATTYRAIGDQLSNELSESSIKDIENLLTMRGMEVEEAKVASKAIYSLMSNGSTNGLSRAEIKSLNDDRVENFIKNALSGKIKINSEKTETIGKNFDNLNKANNMRTVFQDAEKIEPTEDGYRIYNNDGTTHVIHSDNLSTTDADVMQYVSKYNESAQNLFLENYRNSANLNMFDQAFYSAYEMGRKGERITDADFDKYNEVIGYKTMLEAYKSGNLSASEDAKRSAEAIDKAIEGFKAENIKGGKFKSRVDYKRLNKKKQTLYKYAQGLAALGLNVEVIDDKSAESLNGQYNKATNSITINLSARLTAKDIKGERQKYVINTFAHELTHYLEENAKEAYAPLKNMIKLGLQDVYIGAESVWDTQMKEEYDAAIKDGASHEEALKIAESEVIARACEDVLNDNAQMVDILSKNDSGLLQTIRDAIMKFFDKFKSLINKLMGGFESGAIEAQAVREIDGLLDEMRAAWADAFTQAIAKSQMTEKVEASGGIKVDAETGTVVSDFNSRKKSYANEWQNMKHKVNGKNVNYKSYDECIADVAKTIAEKANQDAKKVEEWIKAEESISAMIMREEYADFLDYEADDRYQPVKKNSDYPQGTFDLSNLCRKREIFTKMFDALQRDNAKVLFDADDLATIRQVLAEEHYEVACALCYVEDRRQNMGEIAKTFIGYYQDALKSKDKLIFKINSEGERVALKPTKDQRDKYHLPDAQYKATDKYIPTQYDLVTYEGFKTLQEEHPTIAYAFERYNNSRGMASARVIEGHAEYARQVLGYTENQIAKINSLGGLRVFSFSDFEAMHLIDTVQIINDCAKMGIKIQAYTKVPEFAHLVRNTRMKVNRSLIAANVGSKNAYARVIENGKVKYVKVEPYKNGIAKYKGQTVLAFDIVEGIDITNPHFLDESDNPNIGNILVGCNDEQIQIAMADPFIDYIIPFHTGQRLSVLHTKGIGTWDNYKDIQEDRKIGSEEAETNGKKKKKTKGVNIYDLIKNGNVTNKYEFFDAFIKAAEGKKLIPRFDKFIAKDDNGNYQYTEGYWKMLLDFKLFDAEGNILPQETVVPVHFEEEGHLENLVEEIFAKDVDREKGMRFDKEINQKIKDALKGKHGVLKSVKKLPTQKEFEVSNSVEKTDKFIAVHNLNENELVKSIELGGFPAPSIAIIKYGMSHSNYGAISVLFGRDTVDPLVNSKNKIYPADAYTPVIQGVEYEINQDKFNDFYSDLNAYKGAFSEELNGFTGNYAYTSDSKLSAEETVERFKNNKGLQAYYLDSIGETVERIQKPVERKYRADKIDVYKQIADVYGEEAMENLVNWKFFKSWLDVYGEDKVLELLADTDEFKNEPKKYMNHIKAHNYIAETGEYLKSLSGEVEYKLDTEAMERNLEDAIAKVRDDYEKWLNKKVNSFYGKMGIRNGKDVFTRNGNRRGFKGTHYDWTLENIVKALYENQETQGEFASTSRAEGLQSVASKPYKTIEDARNDSRERLKKIDDEEYKSIMDDASGKISKVFESIMKLNPETDYSQIDNAIADAARSTQSFKAIASVLDGYDLKVNANLCKQISDLFDMASKLPTKYFEAKPERAVYLDEIAKVILPDNVDNELLKSLDKNEIPYEIYKTGDEDQRKELLNSDDSVRFSTKRDSEGKTLTKAQEEFFKDSKIRDENGNLMVMYHGTEMGSFDIFEQEDTIANANFFTDSLKVARAYSGSPSIYAPKNFKSVDEFNEFINNNDYRAAYEDGQYVLYLDDEVIETADSLNALYRQYWYASGETDSLNYKTYLNATNPYIVDGKGADWDGLTTSIKGESMTTNEVVEWARENGYDSVIFRNITDNGLYMSSADRNTITSTVVAVMNGDQIKSVNNTEPTGNADIRYSVKRGTDGIEEYTVSKEVQNMSYAQRRKVFRDIMANQYRGRTAKFYRNGHAYYALFDDKGINKNIYTLGNSTQGGYDAKVKIGATGDIFELVENSRYSHSKAETGNKTNKFHKDSLYWDYYEKTVKFGKDYFDVFVNVKKGTNGYYTYEIELKESSSTPGYSPQSGVQAASNTKVANNNQNVNTLKSVKRTTEQILTAENDRLKADIKSLRELVRLQGKETNGFIPTKSTVEAAAKSILKEAVSTYDRASLERDIANAWTKLQKGNDITEDIRTIADNVVNDIKEEREVDKTYKTMLKNLRATRVRLTTNQIAYAKQRYGNRYRDLFMGKVILANDGTSLDALWERWTEKYPDVFQGMAEEDMVDGLLEAYETIKEASEKVVEIDTEYVTNEVMQTITEKMWNIAAYQTVADKYAGKIKEIRAKHRKEMDALKKARDEQKLADEMHYKKLLAQVREQRNERINSIKEFAKMRKETERERAERKRVIDKIERISKNLRDRLLTDSAKKNVPVDLKVPVLDLLNAIDTSSQQLLGMRGGENAFKPTNKDISIAAAMAKLTAQVNASVKAQADGGFVIDLPGDYAQTVADINAKVADIQSRIGDSVFVLQMADRQTLNDIADMLEVMLNSVRQMNSLIASRNKHSVDGVAREIITEAQKKGERNNASAKAFNAVDDFINKEQITPYYFFKHLGSGGTKIFEELQDGFDKYAFHIRDIVKYSEENWTGKQVKEWTKTIKDFDVKEAPTLEQIENGEEGTVTHIQMTIPQIMSLYCLNKREQARKHINGFGIKIAEFKNGAKTTNAKTVTLAEDEVTRITSVLTDEQIKVADAIQTHMNTVCKDWMNEITMKRFGIIGALEENYFPIKSDSNSLDVPANDTDAASIYRLLNMSFTKQLNENANNAIVVGDIFTVFTDHATDMAKYNAVALPTLDLIKVLNYKEVEKTEGSQRKGLQMRNVLDTAYGRRAVQYITKMLTDLNGGVRTEGGNQIIDTLNRNYKIASVGANLQVALLQGTSALRAMYAINPKYIARGYTRKPQVKKVQSECGISAWKQLGFYQINVNRGLEHQIRQDDNWYNKATDASMKGAEVMDNLTWGYLYNACEEWARGETDYAADSKEFRQAVNDKFREVVYATQVVDSTLTRSDYMRSTNWFKKTSSSFMAEPTLTYNMVYDAFNGLVSDLRKGATKGQALRNNGKQIARAMMAFAAAAIIESALRAGIAKLRKPDDDELYWEKLRDYFLSELNPMSKIPILKDILEIIQGYDSSNMYYAGLESTYKVFAKVRKLILNGESPTYKDVYNAFNAFSQVSGLPASGAMRDVVTLWNTLCRIMGWESLIIK